MKTIISTAMFLAACNAASMPGLEPSRNESAQPELAVRQGDSTTEFPRLASEARLPSADRIRVQLRGDGHEKLTAMVRVCVTSDGTPSDVKLTHSSGVSSLDQAILQDVAAWRFESTPNESCAPFHLTYAP